MELISYHLCKALTLRRVVHLYRVEPTTKFLTAKKLLVGIVDGKELEFSNKF
jgi:hypothetical protein